MNTNYPNIVFCKEDPSLYDDYIKPLDCMDLKRIWKSYIPRNQYGKPAFPCKGLSVFDYTKREAKEQED